MTQGDRGGGEPWTGVGGRQRRGRQLLLLVAGGLVVVGGTISMLAFGPAIAVPHVVGYTDPWHLAPAYGAAAVLGAGLLLSRPNRPHVREATAGRSPDERPSG